jgi:hypothetical protein
VPYVLTDETCAVEAAGDHVRRDLARDGARWRDTRWAAKPAPNANLSSGPKLDAAAGPTI